jgi:malate dehydrogenase (quinone)
MDIRKQNVVDNLVDVVLIGGGIMSATLGAMLSILEPHWRIVLVERAAGVATESSDPWNNAGTGHAGFCELNYMPDPSDGAAPGNISWQFHLSRQWWAYLVNRGLLDPKRFIHSTPHMNLVFGERDIAYLRRRFLTLASSPFFEGLEFTDDPATIRQWAPLVMAGRDPGEPIAATRHTAGTDVDFGALSRDLVQILLGAGGKVLLHHDVRTLRQAGDGTWVIGGRRTDTRAGFQLNAKYVFVGAGGYALRLLQRAGVPEVRGYGVLPVGAAFLR